jgi:hypothetical protein
LEGNNKNKEIQNVIFFVSIIFVTLKFITFMKLFLLLIALCYSIAASSQNTQSDSVPIRLSTLEGSSNGNTARLDWKVVCFLQYAKFEIQRSSNGINYTTINSFEADQLRCRQPFDFTDANITGRVYYRIKVGDLDGRFAVSKIVAISGKANGFEINSLTPSLIHTNTTLSISSATADKAEITITSFQGTVVKRMSVSLNKGTTELPIDMTNLSTGNYILNVTNKSLELKTTRFAKL